MSAPDLFPYVWLGLVALIGVVSPVWAINDLRQGSARLGWHSGRVSRDEEPFEFWLAVGGKFLALPMSIFMFSMGLEMLKW
jgi:hypothetical protein